MALPGGWISIEATMPDSTWAGAVEEDFHAGDLIGLVASGRPRT